MFLAKVPSVGYAVYDVRAEKSASTQKTDLAATTSSLENSKYVVKLNDAGDVASIFDKINNRELLTAPIQLQLLHDKPKQWPAWEIQYDDIVAAPQATVGGKAEITVVENGPARVALEVVRRTDKSTFRTLIRLSSGGDRIEFVNEIYWYERETLLKAAFPLATANESVTYDIGLGTIERGLNTPKKYEVPAQQWADMTSPGGDYGVAIMNDCKYGWDHPDKGTLRLSLIHTPGVYDSWQWVGDQRSQDEGHHEFTYALQGHSGDWRQGAVVWQAARLNQPLIAFQAPKHKGTLGKEYSLLSVTTGGREGKSASSPTNPEVMVTAVKMSETDNDEVVIRMRELNGKSVANVQVRFDKPIVSARELNGAEEPLGEAQVTAGALVTMMKPYEPKTFAVKIGKPDKIRTSPTYSPLQLLYNSDGISTDSDRRDGNIDGAGNSIAGELLADTVIWQNVPFVMGPKAVGAGNVVICGGQKLEIDAGPERRLYVLATAVGGPAEGTFTIGDRRSTVWVQDYAERLGQWNNRLNSGALLEESDRIAPAYINREPIGWVSTHRHTGKGENEAYQFTYLYLLRFEVPQRVTSITLPDNPRLKIFAATLATAEFDDIRAAQPMYDISNAAVSNIIAERTAFMDNTTAQISCPYPGAEIHYTIDDTEPSASSPRYTQPLTISHTTTLKARALLASVDDHYVSQVTFTKLIPKEPVKVAKLISGLDGNYYEGAWSKLPNFDSLKAKKQFVMDTIGIPSFAQKEDFGLVITGYVQVPRDGMYEFAISSDDGSTLTISDSLLVDNDGLHGSGEVAGALALKAGLHPIKVRMFQAKGGEDLRVWISGPGVEKQLIPREMLYHITTTRSAARGVGSKH